MLREHVVDRNLRPEKPSMTKAPQLSDRVWCIIQVCWQAEPTSRPTAGAVHDFVSSPAMLRRPNLPPLYDPQSWERSEDDTSALQSSDGKVRIAGLSKRSVGYQATRTPYSVLGTTGNTIKHSDPDLVYSSLPVISSPDSSYVAYSSASNLRTVGIQDVGSEKYFSFINLDI